MVPVYADRNDGVWQKVWVTAENLADTLAVQVTNPQRPEAGRMTFDALVAFDVRAHYQQQTWQGGVKLFDGTIQARCRIKLALTCEVTARVETPTDKAVPDLVVRVGILKAEVRCEDVVVEKVPGLAPDVAAKLGDAIRCALRRWQPSLERDLLAQASAAIMEAGSPRELRISITSLTGGR
jgi:hypothetical protein